MNYLMNGFFSDSFDRDVLLSSLSGKNDFKTPATDIYETEEEVITRIEVPEVRKEDIKLEVKNSMLSLKAEHKSEKEDSDEKKGYYRVERSYSGFSRSFLLPAEVDEDKVRAKYKDGVLEVHMPKKKSSNEDKVKYISVD